jgi:hypothetical protein
MISSKNRLIIMGSGYETSLLFDGCAGRDGGLLKGEEAREEVRRAMGFAAACGALVCQVLL